MADIDLEMPGKLTASGLNAKAYTFYVMKAQGQYTSQALAANPGCVSAGDLLIKSGVIPDNAGRAEFDLAPHVKTLKDKMGKDSFVQVKVGVIGTAKATNGDPKKRLADVQEFGLMKGAPVLKLNASSKEIDVGANGTISAEVKFLDSVSISANPKDVFHLSKTSLNKSGDLTLTALKDGKATITFAGDAGGVKMTEKIEITSKGAQVTIAAIGLKE